jgi:hypothetical protein
MDRRFLIGNPFTPDGPLQADQCVLTQRIEGSRITLAGAGTSGSLLLSQPLPAL